MAPPWEPSFNFYLSELEGGPVSFVLDMNAQTLPSHPVRLQVRVGLLSPRDDGLRDSSELDVMGHIEDQIVDRLAAALDALFVGRFITAGATVFVFYAPSAAKVDQCVGLIGPLATGYEAQWRSEEDPTWRFFHEFLYPDRYSFQSMMNRSLLTQLEEAGDMLTASRVVDHFMLLPSMVEAEQASAALVAKGFRVDPLKVMASGQYGLEAHRHDSLADQRPDHFVREILDIVLPLNGSYDGWGCVTVRN